MVWIFHSSQTGPAAWSDRNLVPQVAVSVVRPLLSFSNSPPKVDSHHPTSPPRLCATLVPRAEAFFAATPANVGPLRLSFASHVLATESLTLFLDPGNFNKHGRTPGFLRTLANLTVPYPVPLCMKHVFCNSTFPIRLAETLTEPTPRGFHPLYLSLFCGRPLTRSKG